MAETANRHRRTPRSRRLDFFDPRPRPGDFGIEMAAMLQDRSNLHVRAARLHLQRRDRALRRQQVRRKLLLVALRSIANGAKFLELRIDLADASLQLESRFLMAAFDAHAVELGQRQFRRLDIDRLEMTLS